MADRSMNNLFTIPSSSNPILKGLPVYSGCLRPLSRGHGAPTSGDKNISARIVRLFSWRSPLAIRRLIITIVILALNAAPGRTAAHISNEVGELQPPLTNRYTSTAIAEKLLTVGVCAARFHVRPDAIFPRLALPMCSVVAGVYFNHQATAGKAFAKSQIGAYKGSFCSAITPAIPHGNLAFVRGLRNDQQPAEFAPGNVNEVVGALDRVVCGCYDFCRFTHSGFMIGFSGGLLLTGRPSASYNPSVFSQSQRLVNG